MKVIFTPEAEKDIERFAYIQVVSNHLELEYDEARYDYVEDVFYIKSNNKYGIADADGNELIPPRYDWLGDGFVEDMLAVGIRGKGVGFVNKQGEEIIAPQYEEASDFYKGRSAVCLNGKYGAINKHGVIVVPLIHDNIGMYTDKIWVAL